MLANARRGFTILSAFVLSVSVLGGAFAQTVPAVAPPTQKAQVAPPVPDEKLKQVLATVNNEPITRGELYKLLSQYQVPIGKDEQAQVYKDAVETLINTHLVNQFLARQNVPVSEAKIDDSVAMLEKQLKQNGTDLPTEMRLSGKSMAELRKEFANRLRWVEYVNRKGTDAELKNYVAAHKDMFNGTQVKASHILLRTEPTTTAAEKEKLRQKLASIKKEILAGKLTFAQAANKYSEDTGNSEGAGGDLGYFTLNSGFIEEFANPAFAMKKGEMSDPVESPYGIHLILVTDRKEGTPLDFAQQKPYVTQVYAADLQKQLLTAQRKDAKIDIKPMPSDFFPEVALAPAPTQAPAASPAKPK